MRVKIWWLLVLLYVGKGVSGCPPQCVCIGVRAKPGKPQSANMLKLKCSTNSVKSLNYQNLTLDVVQLDFSENNVSILQAESFLHLPLLQKLNLSYSRIYAIEENAFANLTSLKRLDVSGNYLRVINPSMFAGLDGLEKLKLSDNHVSKIRAGAFEELVSLKQLDLSGNPLHCDCHLSGLVDWVHNSSVKLSPSPRCGAPPALKGQPLRKLRPGMDLHCNWPPSSLGSQLELKPAYSQVVFTGDALRLRCRATGAGSDGLGSGARVLWLWGGRNPSTIFKEIRVENRYLADSGLVESSLNIEHLATNHSGQWDCYLVSEQGNHSRAISIIVISNETRYCTHNETVNNKGRYAWPKTVVNNTVELQCAGEPPGHRALHTCTAQGSWLNLNTSSCPYISDTTKILEQFSKVNLSLNKGSVVESARSLANLTTSLVDEMDVVFLARTVDNYLGFLDREKELGMVLVDVVSGMQHLPRDLMGAAQLKDGACSRLVRAVETVAEFTPSLQSHKSDLAVEEFRVKQETFSGMTCTWYTQGVPGQIPPNRLFHCSTSNATTLLGTKVLEASIQVPASLFHQLQLQGIPMASAQQLLVSMYQNNRLFPRMKRPDSRDVTSCVVGSKLVGVEVANLTEPVSVLLRAPISPLGSPRPVWWDPNTGTWSRTGCQMSYLLHDLLGFQCNRLGYFGLLQKESAGPHTSVTRAKMRYSHPAIYVGSLVAVLGLGAAVVTYALCHTSIHMSKRCKHSVANTWFSMALLCFMFSVGIHQTEDVKVCQGIGLVLHYLSLSSLLWMAITISNMYKRLTKQEPSPPEDLPPMDLPAQKPLLGLYLVGWGVSLMVVGISGAVNIHDYAAQGWCFLAAGPAVSAVLVPSSMLLLYIVAASLMVRCAAREPVQQSQLSEGTQATDLDTPSAAASLPPAAPSVPSEPSEDDEDDPEHSHWMQLRAHALVLTLFLLAWALAALATTAARHEALFSVLYALVVSCLGSFVLLFHCGARGDVQQAWGRARHRGRCCRTRSVSDTQPPTPPPAKPQPESNGSVAQDQNVNLVVLHRRQYRADTNAAEAFYNPHQSTVARKFFRRQRRHQNGRRRAESAVFLSSDMESVVQGPPGLVRLVIGAEGDLPHLAEEEVSNGPPKTATLSEEEAAKRETSV